ncbi:MAG TPA: pyrrolo-quinoline quinone [Candidatus Angelobacter sp.]
MKWLLLGWQRLGLALPILFWAAIPCAAQLTTAQYGNARTGADTSETILTPQNVNAQQFGKVFSFKVDGDVYAQPLYLPQLEIPGKGKHHVLFVATEHDSVYAFDGDNNPSSPLWQVSFISPGNGSTPLAAREVQCPFIRPEVGITPTPVIDTKTGTLYVLARTKENGKYFQRLHALDVTTGAEKFGGPQVIQASVQGRKRRLDFDPLRENPRAALLLANGNIYLTWASSCDVGEYHGWVIAYDAHTLKQTGVFNTSPDAEESGIWQSDAGPAADEQGNIYAVTGNGKFDADSGGRDFGDSILKLTQTSQGLIAKDYFTPSDQQKLNANDLDVGSDGPVLLPDQPGPHPHLLITAGKGGGVYVIDRDHMGGYRAGNNSHAVQVIQLGDSCLGAPAYWNQSVYIFCSHDVLRQYKVENGRLSTEPVGKGTVQFTDPGATPTISASGMKNGIVWWVATKTWDGSDHFAVLHADDAANIGHELYTSEENSGRDRAGSALRFVMPTVVHGRVYIGVKGEVDVYGLLQSPQKSSK